MEPARNFDLHTKFVCPACRTGLVAEEDRFECEACARSYPVLFGIPDFRLHGDRYLTLEQEREKAAYLHAYGRTHSFDDLVDEYYRITDDVPREIAKKYGDYVRSGKKRGRLILQKLALDEQSFLLDLGCGSGGVVAAAVEAGYAARGVDIALRWLVIAAKRFEEAGLNPDLVCADVQALPFPSQSVTHVTAADLLEHVRDIESTLHSIHTALVPNGRVWISGSNRFTLAPHPVAGLLGVGYLPRSIRSRYVVTRRGLNTLRNVRLTAPLSTARLFKRHGFKGIRLSPLEVADDVGALGNGGRRLTYRIYAKLRKWPILAHLLLLFGPAFEFVAWKRDG